jgi:hypothetical protein
MYPLLLSIISWQLLGCPCHAVWFWLDVCEHCCCEHVSLLAAGPVGGCQRSWEVLSVLWQLT